MQSMEARRGVVGGGEQRWAVGGPCPPFPTVGRARARRGAGAQGSAAAGSALLPRPPTQPDHRTHPFSPQSRLGGGEGVEGLYGSVTRAGMHRVLASLAQHTGLGRDSHVVDVGSGLGR